jgi:hypothetical protein
MDPVTLLASALLVTDVRPSKGCGKYDQMEKVIIAEYGEQPVLKMMSEDYILLILYANPKLLTWTVLAVLPEQNKSCIIETGTNIQQVFEGKKQGL